VARQEGDTSLKKPLAEQGSVPYARTSPYVGIVTRHLDVEEARCAEKNGGRVDRAFGDRVDSGFIVRVIDRHDILHDRAGTDTLAQLTVRTLAWPMRRVLFIVG